MNLRLPLPPKELGPCYMVWEYFLAHLILTEQAGAELGQAQLPTETWLIKFCCIILINTK